MLLGPSRNRTSFPLVIVFVAGIVILTRGSHPGTHQRWQHEQANAKKEERMGSRPKFPLEENFP